MHKIISIIISAVFACSFAFGQTTQPSTAPSSQPTTMTESPYHHIGDAPAAATSAAMIQRTIDGLGFRYHWATEGLTAADLAYAPGNEGQTAQKVIEHLYGLSSTILHTILGEPNIRPYVEVDMSYAELRHATLQNFKAASDHLRAHPNLDLEKLEIVFVRGEKRSAFPFWNLINGPILDAVYHTGQIVSYRRTTGNPVHPKVNVFMGKGPE